MSQPILRSPVPGPRIVPFGVERLPADRLPNGRAAFRVTQRFADVNRAMPAPFNTQPHGAIDLGNFTCGDEVLAAGPGRAITWRDRYGALGVTLDLGGGWTVLYAHLNAFAIGQGAWIRVTAGQQLGVVGKTGLGAVCHLHVELRFNGVRVDPWPRLAQNIPEEDVVAVTGYSHIVNRRTTLRFAAHFRAAPSTDASSLQVFPAGEAIVPFGQVKGEVVGDSGYWLACSMWVRSVRKTVIGFFHTSVANEFAPMEPLGVSEDVVKQRVGAAARDVAAAAAERAGKYA